MTRAGRVGLAGQHVGQRRRCHLVGQGPAEVRAKADFVTVGNDQDGVALAIDDIILPRT